MFRLLPTTLVVVVVGVLAAACGGTSTGTNKTTSNVPPFDQPGCGIVDAEIAQQVLRTDSIESAGTGFSSDGSPGPKTTECEIDGEFSAQIWIRIRKPSESELNEIDRGGSLLPTEPCKQQHVLPPGGGLEGGSCVKIFDTRKITDLRTVSKTYYVAVSITRDQPSKHSDHDDALRIARDVYAHIED